MLPRLYRLTHSRDIQNVLKNGRAWQGRGLKIRVIKNRRDHSRLAFVVSNKVSKKATVRNRLRRQLRSIIYKNLAKIEPERDVVIVTSPQTVPLSYDELAASLESILRESRLLPFKSSAVPRK